ncbi:hypothetical protein DDE05_40755, partial [Streptomyces cavourensis]
MLRNEGLMLMPLQVLFQKKRQRLREEDVSPLEGDARAGKGQLLFAPKSRVKVDRDSAVLR